MAALLSWPQWVKQATFLWQSPEETGINYNNKLINIEYLQRQVINFMHKFWYQTSPHFIISHKQVLPTYHMWCVCARSTYLEDMER